MPYGYSHPKWATAKRQATAVLAQKARDRGMIAYSDLVSRIDAIHFDPHGRDFAALLGEISTDESQAGRGMLTALVVHKEGDMQPGPGFYELAEQLGRDVADIDTCWVNEFKTVFGAWAGD